MFTIHFQIWVSFHSLKKHAQLFIHVNEKIVLYTECGSLVCIVSRVLSIQAYVFAYVSNVIFRSFLKCSKGQAILIFFFFGFLNAFCFDRAKFTRANYRHL